jgi:uncharacterized protein YndB with AHSA1/START domain
MTNSINSQTSSTDRIEREILLKASRSRVWRALSDAEEFGSWFGVALKGKTFVPGQLISGSFTISGHEHMVFEALIVEMQPERLFSYRWHPYNVDPAIDYSKEEKTLVVIELHDAKEGILLKVTESGFDKVPATRRQEAFMRNTGGWEWQLKNIANYVSQN